MIKSNAKFIIPETRRGNSKNEFASKSIDSNNEHEALNGISRDSESFLSIMAQATVHNAIRH